MIKALKVGIKSMQSIKPKLGDGIGHVKDKNRGKIFPQFKLKNKKNLDDYFSKKGIIILSSGIKAKNIKNCSLLKVNNLKSISAYLKNINSKAILVRPDRFILGSANSNQEFNSILKKYSNILR